MKQEGICKTLCSLSPWRCTQPIEYKMSPFFFSSSEYVYRTLDYIAGASIAILSHNSLLLVCVDTSILLCWMSWASKLCWGFTWCLLVGQVWYPLSKTLAEKAAWKFAKEKALDIVVVNPGTVMGPILPPALNASMLMILRLLQGNHDLNWPRWFKSILHFYSCQLS